MSTPTALAASTLAHLQENVNIKWTAVWTLPVVYVFAVVVYRIFFHPLAKYPGPFLAKFTDIYPILQMVKMTRIYWQLEMIETYGSPVRVATNELYFADAKSWVDIYGQSSNPCPKEPVFYDMFTATGATSVLNERDKTAHARVRRLLSHAFSLKALLQDEPLVHQKVEELVDGVFAPAAKNQKSVDIFGMMMCHYLDIVSYLSFGKSFDSVSGHGEISHHDMDCFMVVVPVQSFFPFLRYVPIPKIQEGYRGLRKLINFAQRSVIEFQEKVKKEGDGFAQGTFLRNLIDARDEETGGSKLTFEELVENTIIFLIAGSDTTAVTTMYIIWECGKNPQVKKKLVDEIRTAFPDPKHAPTYQEASKLPYLNACIDEALRLWGPLNAGFPRVSSGKVIGNKYIPEGVTVSTIPYATHRDPKVFPNPEEFIPDRWLNSSAEMRGMLKPFSHGPRNCIGKHLAEIGMHLTLTRLYQLYDIENDPSMTDAMMRQKDRGVAAPWDAKFLIRPTPAKR